MVYGSVCSGIEAASVAWHVLGWRPAFFAEIDKFPSAVLAHHYPHVPNFGDFTRIGLNDDGKGSQCGFAPIDLLVGGTPCQSFSIAGLRGGLADDRGNLALEFLRLARRTRPRWLVWENVPGVLSSNGGRDFGAILGGMVECGYGVAYRVLDAQFVRVDGMERAVPQRRRRVFVVGYSGDPGAGAAWRCAAAVLFERASLSGDSPPRRETGERIAPTIGARPTGGGGLGTDFDCDGGLIAHPLRAQPNAAHDASKDTYVAHTLNGKGGAWRIDGESETFVAHTLTSEGFDVGGDGSGRGTPIVPIAFDSKASWRNGFAVGEIAPTLRAMGHKDTHQNSGGQVAVAFAENSRAEVRLEGGDGAVTAPLTTGGGQGWLFLSRNSRWMGRAAAHTARMRAAARLPRRLHTDPLAQGNGARRPALQVSGQFHGGECDALDRAAHRHG